MKKRAPHQHTYEDGFVRDHVSPQSNYKGQPRWLLVRRCTSDKCDYRYAYDITYEEPPKEKIWRVRHAVKAVQGTK